MIAENAERRVLVPLDDTDSALALVALAAAMAARLDAEIVLMRVVRPGLPPLFRRRVLSSEQTLADTARIVQTEQAVRQADAELQCLAAAVAASGTRVTRVVLVGTDAAARIVDWLQTHPVTLIVAAARARTGTGHLLGFGMTERLVRSGLAPVMTVSCFGRATREADRLQLKRTKRWPCCATVNRSGRSRWRV